MIRYTVPSQAEAAKVRLPCVAWLTHGPLLTMIIATDVDWLWMWSEDEYIALSA